MRRPAAVGRQHPFLSPIGLLGGLVLITGIGLAVLFGGGEIFSPGPLTAQASAATPLHGFKSHAEFEKDCRRCHAPLTGVTAERCQTCHADIVAQRQAGSGLHGHLKPAVADRCGDCHLDHQGRQLDINANALKQFDHTLVNFDLRGHLTNYDYTPLTCQGCHPGAGYQIDTATCVKCHTNHDAGFMGGHVIAFGTKCLDCHDGVDKTKSFDHAKTAFPLMAKHAELACAVCHKAGQAPKDTPATCAGCHKEPAAHATVFGADCAACHTAAAWSPAKVAEQPVFQHTSTSFQLRRHASDYTGAVINCRQCHPGAAASASKAAFAVSEAACATCHTQHDAVFMDKHQKDFGPHCADCHDGAGNMKAFDHAKVIALDGAHAALPCAQCHVDQKFKNTARDCSGCHQEPKVHAGLFGANCAACHTTTAWAPAQLTQHSFPLDHGGKGDIACANCHASTYTTYTCYGCHDHTLDGTQQQHANLKLTPEKLADCKACHATGHKLEGTPTP